MSGLSFAEIQNFTNQIKSERLPPLNIAICRNVMLEPMEPYLRYFAYQLGFEARISWGDYDNVFQEAVGGQGGLLTGNLDCVLVFLKLEMVSWDLARNFTALDPEQVRVEVERVKNYIKSVLAGIRGQTRAMLLWHAFELPVFPALGIVDSQSADGQLAVIRDMNEFLRNCLCNQDSAYLVDLNLCLFQLGAAQFYDLRYWHIGRVPFTRQALARIAEEDFKFIRALKGKNKKCLVLDCDNVLWGGVIGEDGLAGIRLSKTHPGSAYYEFQQEVLNLYHRGILLALCSKNNAGDVWEVFTQHPAMVLKEEHIAVAEINWEDKATNLRKIAGKLNIGLDSLVFVDDSEFEVNLIRETAPEVTVIHLPVEKATTNRDVLASCGLFDTLTLSWEDKQRNRMYRAEAFRAQLQAEITNMETYYRSLEMKVTIRFANEFALPRIAQLTQKTNQFNLTTRRYIEAEIKEWANRHTSDVIYLELSDRFGDMGIVGVCILSYQDRQAVFDTFLLSCRVLGRGVEDVFIAQALELAQLRGCTVAVGEYYPTRKNVQVAHFYDKHGFYEMGKNDRGVKFQCRLAELPKPAPFFFKQIISEIDGQEEILL